MLVLVLLLQNVDYYLDIFIDKASAEPCWINMGVFLS